MIRTAAPSLPSATTRTHRALERHHARLRERDDGILRAQVAVSEIPAPTGEEHERGRWIMRRFAELGLADVRVDDTGNVIGRRRGATDEAPVVVCAHLDKIGRAHV